MIYMKNSLLVLIVALSFISCSNLEKGDLKKTFTVKRNDSSIIDTLIISKGRDKAEYLFKSTDSNGISVENKRTINFQGDTFLSLEGAYLDNTKYLPSPDIPKKLATGEKIYSEFEVDFNDKKEVFKGEIEIVAPTQYNVSLLQDDTWILNASSFNKNDKKLYKATYYYNERYGFVYYHYEIDNMIIDIDLIEIHE